MEDFQEIKPSAIQILSLTKPIISIIIPVYILQEILQQSVLISFGIKFLEENL